MFNCPVPDHLRRILISDESVIDDHASLFIDLISIRTPPRYDAVDQFLPPKYDVPPKFDADAHYGIHHVLPLMKDSGRWENTPICKPSLKSFNKDENTNHTLIEFTWTSNNYKTRKQCTTPDGEWKLSE